MNVAERSLGQERFTLGAELEARRLEHRARRMDHVVRALKDRARGYERSGDVPRPLQDAVAEFSRRLSEDRARLAELRRVGQSRARPEPKVRK